MHPRPPCPIQSASPTFANFQCGCRVRAQTRGSGMPDRPSGSDAAATGGFANLELSVVVKIRILIGARAPVGCLVVVSATFLSLG